MVNGMIIDSLDNVGMAIELVQQGQTITYIDKGDNAVRLTAAETIPIYHKFALCNIQKNSPIVKYGQHIGIAAIDIEAGQYVHVHNVKSMRENLG